MRATLVWATVCCCWALERAAWAQASERAAHGPEPAQVELAGGEVRLEMESFEARPLVRLRVNGKGPYPFVLDTAASGSRISGRLVRELGLEPVGEARVRSGVGNAVGAKLYRLDTVRSGDVIKGVVAVGGLMEEARPSVLAISALRDVTVTLDFPGKQVRVATEALPPADGKSVFDVAGPLLSVNAAVGNVPLRLHPDTGSPGGLDVPEELAPLLPLTGPPKVVGRARTVNADFEIKEAPLSQRLTVGRAAVELHRVGIIPGLREALLGCEILRLWVLRIDTRNRRWQIAGGNPAAPTRE